MLKKLLFLVFISSLSFSASNKILKAAALQDPQDLIRDAINANNFIGATLQLRNLQQDYINSLFHQFYFDTLATYESFLGMTREALRDDDIALYRKTGDDPSFDFGVYQIKNAKELIVNASKIHQVIFINEAHHSPENRAFTISLLKDLYNNGYRYFAVETLNEDDIELNLRAYPLTKVSGFYVDEPLYGELIRAALKIGYKIIAYDVFPDCEPEFTAAEKCQNLREEGQAKNLYERVFKVDPQAKLLVHAGYGHITKKQVNKWIPMAVYFEKITGIMPFSIDQTTMRERSSAIYENNVYRDVTNYGIKDVSALVNGDGTNYVLDNLYDLMLFHPRTHYINNRPNWLYDSEQRKQWPVALELCKNTFPCVVEAFLQNEGIRSVPIDRIVLFSQQEQATLLLIPGIYVVRAINQFGETLSTLRESYKYI